MLGLREVLKSNHGIGNLGVVGITRKEGDGKAYDNLVIVMPYRPNRHRIEQDVQNEPGRC